MKKIALIAVSALLVALSSQAQGLVNFNNSASAGSKISTNSIVGGSTTALTSGGVGSFYYALFSSAATTVNGGTAAMIPTVGVNGTYAWSDAAWTFQAYATNSATVGRVAGLAQTVIAGVPSGGSAQFLVIGWSANLGTTIGAVQSALISGNFAGTAFLGQSAVSGAVIPGDTGTTPIPTILAASGAVGGFTLGVVNPVPEPSTMVLAGLGGLSLLAFRRKK